MKRLIIAMTGASGSELGLHLLQLLCRMEDVETHLIVSDGAKQVLKHETALSPEELYRLADHVYDEHDLAACISSGTFRTDGMVVVPCSMKTLSSIVNAYDENLIVRAADVCLKEGRKVVLVPRETPFSKAHLRNLLQAANDGCVILPPMLSFYGDLHTLEAQIHHINCKICMQFDLEPDGFQVWTGV